MGKTKEIFYCVKSSEFVIELKRPNAWITIFSSQPSADAMLSGHCRQLIHLLKVCKYNIFSNHNVSQNILKFSFVIFLFCRRVALCCSTQSSNQRHRFGGCLKNIPSCFSESNITWISGTFKQLPSARLRSWLVQ